MASTRNLNADGILFVNGEEMGPCDYQLNGYNDGRHKWADGVLSADPAALAAALNSSAPALVRLHSGAQVELLVTRLSLGSEQAEVKATGPVPGL